jgi:ADP-heptose:LPS heptosyltransferase
LKSVLAVTNLLVGNDSGPAHLAAGVGTNTLTIFGSTDIKHCVKFGSYLGGHEYLVAEPRLSCQPCYKPICPTNKECMSVISVDKVYKTIIGILEGEKNA